MTKLTWDQVGERLIESGVSHGVLYPVDDTGSYGDGVAWNGLTGVTESPSGAESNKQYADNQVYVNLLSLEQFGGTIEAFMYPDEWAQCDGSAELTPGVTIGQQGRRAFGLVYETLLGNDVEGLDFNKKIHIVYGALASPSEKAYATVNDSPEAMGLSWEFSTTPIELGVINGVQRKPTATLVVDCRKFDPADITALEDILYGDAGGEARLPFPDEVYTLLGTGTTAVNMNLAANQPTFVNGTGVITLPTVAGVQWKVNGVNKAPGAQPAIAVGDTADVDATPTAGNTLVGDTDFSFTRV